MADEEVGRPRARVRSFPLLVISFPNTKCDSPPPPVRHQSLRPAIDSSLLLEEFQHGMSPDQDAEVEVEAPV